MTADFFELLGLPRQAAIDEEDLQRRFHERAAEIHPDRAKNPAERADFSKRSAELNQAWQTLKNPVTRLRHLLELLCPGDSVDAGLNEELMQLFAAVGGSVQRADAFLAKKRAAGSTLAKALLAEEEIRVQSELQATLAAVTSIREVLSFKVSQLAELRQLYTNLSFLEKWQRQLNERLLALLTG